MPLSTLEHQADYDLFCAQKLQNPYPLFHELRVKDPVRWCEPLNTWLAFRYGDTPQETRRRAESAQRAGFTAAKFGWGRWARRERISTSSWCARPGRDWANRRP